MLAEILRGAPPAEMPGLAWPLVCGNAVAARTQAVGFEAGTLRVAVPDAVWRAQLTELAPRYLASFARLLPADTKIKDGQAPPVERIEFLAPPNSTGPGSDQRRGWVANPRRGFKK